MARTRRSQTSMKCAIGRGCMLLFAGVTCVALSVTKVIVGSEYVSSCPSREMIPIFVIVSGCLPVLLSALRQPYDSGHETNKDKFSMRVSFVTALLGVIINLAWLVAGTYLVIKTWNSTLCAHQQSVSAKLPNSSFCNVPLYKNDSEKEGIAKNSSLTDFLCPQNDSLTAMFLLQKSALFNETYVMNTTNNDQSGHNFMKRPVLNEDRASHMESTAETIGDQEGTADHTNSITGHTNSITGHTNSITGHTNSITEALAKQESATGHLDSKAETLDNLGGAAGQLTSINETLEQLEGNVTKTVTNGFAKQDDKSCITCDIGILSFSLAVIIVDWLFVLFGSLYFCYFVYHRFASLKDQLLLINA